MTRLRQGDGKRARWLLSALRGIAIAIAIAALIDPVWIAAGPPLRQLIAIDLTAGDSDRVIAELQARAPAWQVIPRHMTGGRLPCGLNERCIAMADGSIDAGVPADVAALSMIAVRRSGSPNLALRSAVVSAGHVAAAGAVRVELSRVGAIASTDIRIRDGAAIVGAATHKWAAGPAGPAAEAPAKVATIDVPWWPIAAGARTLRVEAVAIEGEITAIDNAIDVGVTVAADQSRVLVFDARPSWSSTFVRRALDDDPRFAVEYRARVAPGLSAGTANGAIDADPSTALRASVLEASQVVIAGGLDALTPAEAALLDRYVTRRGGSLILLPERRPGGALARFFGDAWTEHLTPSPQRIGPLHATEILRTDRPPIAAAVLGRPGSPALGAIEGSASIVAVPSGHGRVIISGAMDAWRFRSSAFDRFWRSLVADASAAGDALRIEFASDLAARGQRVPFTLRYRTLEEHSAVQARVSVKCGGSEPAAVRTWPTGALDEFAGEFAVSENGQCRVEATAGNRSAVAFLAIADRPRRGVEATLAKLEHSTRDKGGVIVEAGDLSELARALDDVTAESSQIVSLYPMRASWWIIPFAGCLSLEWFLRRRHGLR